MIFRVSEPGRSAFRLRGGEEGVSVFDPDRVNPPLTEPEILDAFRPGSILVSRSIPEIELKGLTVVPIAGAEPLSRRLRDAHAEIRPGSNMDRTQFKRALKELE
jgi:hypothetical protein